MSFKILSSEEIASGVIRMTVLVPEVTRNARPGQFVVVICDSQGERIPLTIVDADVASGVLTIIFQAVGYSTCRMSRMKPGDALYAVMGPLGQPTHVEKFGRVICIGGGVGIAEMLPIARAMKAGGNRVTAIIGARNKGLLILERELRGFCDEVLPATDDGSYGRRGFVTDILKDKLEEGGYAYVYAVGPVAMMRRVSEMTRPSGIRTIVSLNPLMLDATGMCGVCRCRVAGKTVFGCVDGPEFNAHEVDFDELTNRLASFREEEAAASKIISCGGSARGGDVDG